MNAELLVKMLHQKKKMKLSDNPYKIHPSVKAHMLTLATTETGLAIVMMNSNVSICEELTNALPEDKTNQTVIDAIANFKTRSETTITLLKISRYGDAIRSLNDAGTTRQYRLYTRKHNTWEKQGRDYLQELLSRRTTSLRTAAANALTEPTKWNLTTHLLAYM